MIQRFAFLVQVVDTWADKGCRGHLVYKYRLERLEGQPKLTTDQVGIRELSIFPSDLLVLFKRWNMSYYC